MDRKYRRTRRYVRRYRPYTKRISRYRPYVKRYRRRKPFDFYKLSRSPQGFPPKYHCRLRLAQQEDVNPAAVFAQYKLALNSCADPLGNAGANQPQYFDQLSLLYNRYYVSRAYCRVTFVNTGADPVLFSTRVAIDDEDSASIAGELSAPSARWKVLAGVGNGASNKATIVRKMVTKNWSAKNDDLTSTVATDPNKIIHCFIRIDSIKYDASPANVTGELIMEIVQNVLFYEREHIEDA